MSVRRGQSSAPGGRVALVSTWSVALAVGVCLVIGVNFIVVGYRFDRNRAMSTSTVPNAVDIGFAQDMAIHHGQAVLMANEAVLHASSSRVRLLAREILVQQSQEIGMMRTWLADWHMPQLPSGPLMAWMQNDQMTGMAAMSRPASMTDSTPSDRMPGLATRPQLVRLAAAKGSVFDALFLKLMLRHHEGGIEMADDAAQHASLPQVRAAAGGMVVDQTNECTLIEELLKAAERQR